MTVVAKVAGSWISLTVPEELSGDAAANALREYVGNPLFRAARFEELEIDDNPYRRPVRPDDLEWLRFDQPLARANYAQLSGLLGHRMLLNIYDAGRPLLPAAMTPEKWVDFDSFYGADNRLRGERVRCFLENHVFDFVHRATVDELDRPAQPDGPAGVDELVRRIADERTREADELVSLMAGSTNPERAVRLVSIQLVASALNAPLRITPAIVRRAVDAVDADQGPAAQAGLGDTAIGIGDVIAVLAERSGLSWQPHRYYQFYLPSTLALMNYLNATQYDHQRVFSYLGAMAARTIDHAAFTAAGGTGPGPSGGGAAGLAVTARPSGVDDVVRWLHEHVAEPIAIRCGERGMREFARGMAEYATLLSVHHDDVCTQLRWIDAAPQYRRKAERLQAAITEHNIAVHLDTFVESWEECSTTHVHDEDRLLIIESGEMEFWNCFGEVHKMSPGDKLFVPKHRLHGSVVQSGECVYHQPVITPEINERYG
jgi:hypothetical protein